MNARTIWLLDLFFKKCLKSFQELIFFLFLIDVGTTIESSQFGEVKLLDNEGTKKQCKKFFVAQLHPRYLSLKNAIHANTANALTLSLAL